MLSFFYALLNLLMEMAPWLLFGFFVTGILHVFVPQNFFRRYLAASSFWAVLGAALLGIPLPLCSCGVIPTAMALRKEGISRGAAVSFLTSTPQTGVDSILATWSLLGLPFALIRPLVALVTGLAGGLLVNWFVSEDSEPRTSEISGPSEISEIAETRATSPLCLGKSVAEVFRYGFVEMIQDLGKWLTIGLLLAAAITVSIPDDFFAFLADKPWLGMIFVLLTAVPSYVCATGSIPVAAALMMKGFSPGAAFVFLMAGPATNLGAMLIVGKVLGKKTLTLYLTAILCGALLAGCLIDGLCPPEWFAASYLPRCASCVSCHSPFEWVKALCGGLLVFLLLNALVFPKLRRAFASGIHASGEFHSDRNFHSALNASPNQEEIMNETSSETRTYVVSGMVCSHCKAFVETTIRKLPGVALVEVQLETGIVAVTGTASEADVVRAVRDAGYEIQKK